MTNPHTGLPEILSRAIRIATVASPDDREAEKSRLRAWQDFLVQTFPLVHRECERHVLSEYAVYYRLPAAEPGEGLRPVLLLAHYDVVPADDTGWRVAPFSGEELDGAIWGRGALDNKTAHTAILQALESLLERGYRPERDIYLAFGGDEETGGEQGAHVLSEHFRSAGIRFGWLLDEGSVVADGILPGLDGPVAVIGTAEKGHAIVRLTARTSGGHAAHPPRMTAADALARACAKIARRRFPVRIIPTVGTFIRRLGTLSSGIAGVLLRMYPFTGAIVRPVLSRSSETDAMIRDTRSITMIQGSSAPNVIASEVSVLYNVRLLPGTTLAQILDRFRKIVTGFGIEVALENRADNNEAPNESPAFGDGYDQITWAIGAVWSDVPVVPYLFTMTTDSRHYTTVCDRIYRFLPVQMKPEDLATIHGTDEHIHRDNIERALRFYTELLSRCSTGFHGGDH